MSVTSDPILAVAVRAARRAASVLIDTSRDLRRLPTFSREHGEIATSAGAEALNAIAATISAAFPEHAILSQDSGAVNAGNPTSQHRWIVDPIDGSLNAWGVAAGALLVSEAGGRVGDFAGGSEFLRTNEVIAAAPGLFNPLREAIAAALPG